MGAVIPDWLLPGLGPIGAFWALVNSAPSDIAAAKKGGWIPEGADIPGLIAAPKSPQPTEAFPWWIVITVGLAAGAFGIYVAAKKR